DNFYFLQEDHLRDAADRAGFGWTILRPQVVYGESFASPMNLVPALGAYAAILRRRGEPLSFPGGAPHVSERRRGPAGPRARVGRDVGGRARRGVQHHERRRVRVAPRVAGDRRRVRHGRRRTPA